MEKNEELGWHEWCAVGILLPSCCRMQSWVGKKESKALKRLQSLKVSSHPLHSKYSIAFANQSSGDLGTCFPSPKAIWMFRNLHPMEFKWRGPHAQPKLRGQSSKPLLGCMSLIHLCVGMQLSLWSWALWRKQPLPRTSPTKHIKNSMRMNLRWFKWRRWSPGGPFDCVWFQSLLWQCDGLNCTYQAGGEIPS